MDDSLEIFFKNRDLVIVVDAVAKKYGITPYQVLEMSIYEFCFNSAVLVVTNFEEERMRKKEESKMNKGENSQNLDSFGIDRTIIKDKK